ncbi:MAG TPA: undecaprenyldiphospho-muramoylpentapeptide beta-N-acetylglucosaminyltransferase [Nitrospinota bacterium]|nr:undecaprenyldiphospho-muramoylpentapeptide beta-N-acetylglucosaminyltransferase [Nitrospinota bacterium]
MKVLIAGGGTGGHVYPGISLAKELLKRNPETDVLFIGTKKGLENSILAKEGFKLKRISVGGLKGKISVRTIVSLLKLPIGFLQSLWILLCYKPDIVIGVGGYVTGPVVSCAYILRIPIIIQEQNFLPGVTNRILGIFADKIAISFKETEDYFSKNKVIFTGNPIRREFLEQLKNGISNSNHSKFTLLIFGGSQGAQSINRAVIEGLEYLKEFKDSIRIIHQVGKGNEELMKKEYEKRCFLASVQPFIYNIVDKYKEADLIICRAGATTLSELTVAGKASILIPFPFSANNHQEINARKLQMSGAAEMILEKDLTGEFLAKKILELMKDRGKLKDMCFKSKKMAVTDAAEKIIDICYSLIKKEEAVHGNC